MYVQRVALKEVKYHAFHGFYPEEQLIGCNFLVDAEVTFYPKGDSEDLAQTVNYEMLNQVIAEEMQRCQKLLETVVLNIITQIRELYPFLLTAKVGIRKLNPPMTGEVGYSFVELCFTAEI